MPLCFRDGGLWAVMEGARYMTGSPYAVIITLDYSGQVDDRLVLGFDLA